MLKPKKLFLIDGLGAFITAFLLGIVLRTFNSYFGMPSEILTRLSLVAIIFCMYSLLCFFLLKNNWKPFLKAIGIANVVYCVLTLTLVIHYYAVLTMLGLIYFTGEIITIAVLVFIEWKTWTTSDR